VLARGLGRRAGGEGVHVRHARNDTRGVVPPIVDAASAVPGTRTRAAGPDARKSPGVDQSRPNDRDPIGSDSDRPLE
jgi:hypothetical protein